MENSDVTRHDATSRDTSRHTLTIKQAANLFSDLGAPRSPRSVQRFCELGHIDCIRVQSDKTERYVVDPLSVERYAAELKQLENLSQLGNDVSRHNASQRDMTRNDVTPVAAPVVQDPRQPDRETDELRERVDSLQKENFQLQIDRAAKEQVIGHMVDERRNFIEKLTDQSREIGQLETRLQQLAAPNDDMTRHDATAATVIVLPAEEAVKEAAAEPVPAPVIAEPASKTQPWWRRW